MYKTLFKANVLPGTFYFDKELDQYIWYILKGLCHDFVVLGQIFAKIVILRFNLCTERS